ncbi:hypothetical protein Tco_1581061, partial [Tanacetum coccineum]
NVQKKFNYFDCTSVSTPMDTSEKLMPNNGQAVSQLEYYRVIGCLMYAMTCTRPDIGFVVGTRIITSLHHAPESSKIQKPIIDLEQESEKSASEIRKIKREQSEKQKMPKYTIKSIDKAALKEYDKKSTLYQTMHENKSFNRNPANHRLYHALIKSLIEDDNTMNKGVADIVKDHKRKHDDDDDNECRSIKSLNN